MRKFKILSLVLSVVLAVGLLGGCVGGGEDYLGGEEVKDGDLVVWTADPLVGDYMQRLNIDKDDKKALMTRDIINGFKEKTGVKAVLKSKGWGVDLNKELQNAVGAGTMPDITIGEQFVRGYIEGGHFEPINLPKETIDDLLPELKAVGMMDGKLYAAPLWTGSFALNINLKALRDCDVLNNDNTVNATWQAAHPGVEPLQPKTWEDLLEICTYLKAKMDEKGKPNGGGILMCNSKDGSAWRALTYMRTAGGDFVDEGGNVDMDNTANRKAYEMMRSLVKTSPTNSINASTETYQWDNYFFKDLAAYTVEGNDILIKAAAKGRAADFTAVELPTYAENGVKANVVVGSGYYSISKTSKMKDTALKFIEYILQPDIQLKIMTEDMRVSSRRSVLDSAEVKALPTYDKFKTFIAPFNDDSYDFEGGLPSFNNNPSEIWECWTTFSNSLFKANSDGTYKDMDTIVKKVQSDMYNKQQTK